MAQDRDIGTICLHFQWDCMQVITVILVWMFFVWVHSVSFVLQYVSVLV